MDAQMAEKLGRLLGEKVANTISLPTWPEDVRTEEYGALWDCWADGLTDQIRISLVRNKPR